MSAPAQVMTPRGAALGITRRVVQMIVLQTIYLACLLIAAGDPGWSRAWIFTGASLLVLLLNFLYVVPRNAEVIVERSRRHRGTKGFDRVFGAVFGLAVLATLVVAGLDVVRFSWSSIAPLWIAPGIGLLLIGNIPVAWALATNPHLETSVRVQTDRRHRVVDTGPYARVRHPMYVGIIVQYAGLPMILGSLWCIVPLSLAVLSLVLRTALEDRTLQDELPGYREFAQRTRYRLLPGVW